MNTIDEQIENAKKLLKYLEEQKANECEAAEPDDAQIGALKIFNTSHPRTADIFCNSRDILRNAITAIGEDRIKKYYLKVKE